MAIQHEIGEIISFHRILHAFIKKRAVKREGERVRIVHGILHVTCSPTTNFLAGVAGYEHIRVSEFQPDGGATVKERIHVRTSDHRCRRVRMEMPS